MLYNLSIYLIVCKQVLYEGVREKEKSNTGRINLLNRSPKVQTYREWHLKPKLIHVMRTSGHLDIKTLIMVPGKREASVYIMALFETIVRIVVA